MKGAELHAHLLGLKSQMGGSGMVVDPKGAAVWGSWARAQLATTCEQKRQQEGVLLREGGGATADGGIAQTQPAV